MIHIADTKVAPRYGDYFLRQISIIPGSKDECLQQINVSKLLFA